MNELVQPDLNLNQDNKRKSSVPNFPTMVPTTIPTQFPIETQSPLAKSHQSNKEDRSRAQHPELSFEDYEKSANVDFAGEMALNPIERDEDGL